MGGFAWVTLATNDSYSLGALVLGHSLRRAGTPHDLVALVTPGVSAAMRSQLSTVFTVVQEVNVLDSRDTANLALMSRPELGITFTKLHCWRLTQYEKCVFLDADTLVLKNCDELFDREELSAAPDPGWPDCFNSGVFVYRPSQDTYDALIKFAVVKGSFDGGDQGLLNLFFSDWSTKDISKHLPFIYNMVSSATYSYLPAYKQYGEGAKIAHFIGANKPWLQYFDSETRLVRPPQGSEHLQSLLQLWWDIFCSTVHPSLSPEMLGLAGALAQLTLGVPRSAEQTALEEHMRKQAWEHGSMDYMGRDSFDNIWRKIEETLAEAPSKPEAQKPATEVPPTESVPDSTLPEPKPSKTPTDTSETTGLSSLRFESTSSTQETKAPPPLAETVALGQDSAKPMSDIPNTPSVTEATPPTSPPVVPHTAPIADIQALKVDAPPPETPPVGSEPVKLVANTEHIESLKVAEQPKTKQEGTSPETVTHITQEPVPLQPSSEAGGLGSPLLGKTSGNEPLKSAVSSETESSHSPEVPVLTEAAPPSKIPETLTDEAKSATSLHQVSPSTQETSVVTEVKSVAVPQPVSKVESPAPLTSIETSQPTTTKSVPEAKTETLPQPVSEIEPVKQQEPPAPLISIEISQSTTTKSVPEAKTETLPQPVSKIEPVKQQEPSAPLTSIETSKPTTTKSVPEANIETVPQVAEKDKSKSLESTAAVKPKVQSKPEEASKALPKSSGSTPPSTPDAPPSEQAPIPPKRRGHKAGGSAHAAEQGAASKPTSHAQHQQPKGSKPSQKGKK